MEALGRLEWNKIDAEPERLADSPIGAHCRFKPRGLRVARRTTDDGGPPGLHYLRNGATFDLAADDGVIRIGRLG